MRSARRRTSRPLQSPRQAEQQRVLEIDTTFQQQHFLFSFFIFFSVVRLYPTKKKEIYTKHIKKKYPTHASGSSCSCWFTCGCSQLRERECPCPLQKSNACFLSILQCFDSSNFSFGYRAVTLCPGDGLTDREPSRNDMVIADTALFITIIKLNVVGAITVDF